MKPLLILRPEPGNSATAARARTLGLRPIQCPLFAVEGVEWAAPETGSFNYLLLTSANAVRHGESQLADLRDLRLLAVGAATASEAREAGLIVERTGDGGVAELLAALPVETRLLHLAGAEHHRPVTDHSIDTIVVYRTVPLSPTIPDGKLVAVVHSARAGARLASLVRDQASVAIAAISPDAADACGDGWAAIEVASRPEDSALLALAARLCPD
jgi:uroporphyrinogen-III synthase